MFQEVRRLSYGDHESVVISVSITYEGPDHYMWMVEHSGGPLCSESTWYGSRVLDMCQGEPPPADWAVVPLRCVIICPGMRPRWGRTRTAEKAERDAAAAIELMERTLRPRLDDFVARRTAAHAVGAQGHAAAEAAMRRLTGP